MVRGTRDIITWFENTKMPYWRIYPYKNIGGGNICLQSEQEEGQSPGDALEKLRQDIRVLCRDHYTIAAFPEPNKLPTKGYHWVHFEIVEKEGQQAQISGPVGISQDDVQRQISQALTAYKAEVELDQLRTKVKELEKDNKELKSSADSPINKVLGALAPHAPQIFGNMFGGQPGVAGFPPPDAGPVDNHITEAEVVEGTDLTPEQSAIISEFINELSTADADWLKTLERLTKAIKEKPSLIAMVKTFI